MVLGDRTCWDRRDERRWMIGKRRRRHSIASSRLPATTTTPGATDAPGGTASGVPVDVAVRLVAGTTAPEILAIRDRQMVTSSATRSLPRQREAIGAPSVSGKETPSMAAIVGAMSMAAIG